MNHTTPHAGIDVGRMERAIDFRRLRYFVNIVAEGSFSMAAQRVRVAQPALSHHVRELEAIFGVSLLTRSPHGVAPTEAGRCLYEHGLKILGNVREAAVEVSAFNSVASGHVRLGIPASVAALLAAPLIKAARRRCPDIQLRIEEGYDADILKCLADRRLDMGLLYDVPASRDLVGQPLLTEPLCLIGPPCSAGDEIAFDEVVRMPLILPTRGNRLRDRLDRAAQAANAALDVVIEIDSVASIRTLVRAGLGWSVLTAAEVSDEVRLGVLHRQAIVDPSIEQTLYLCTLGSAKASRSAITIRKLLPQVVGDLVSRSQWPGAPSSTVRDDELAALALA
jgi:LysR family nitrogen assimilation transcriptional regulator